MDVEINSYLKRKYRVKTVIYWKTKNIKMRSDENLSKAKDMW